MRVRKIDTESIMAASPDLAKPSPTNFSTIFSEDIAPQYGGVNGSDGTTHTVGAKSFSPWGDDEDNEE